ncbi:MAG: hypothetical protein Q8K26_01375 [Candidatus Gracilibacteria bacterium]|nr:hypothetical protein [Candidatus Gracilibacteria bacterium]
MKKLVSLSIVVSSLLLFTSCGTTGDSSLATTPFAGEGFSIDVPSAWVKVEKEALPVTKNGAVVLALTSTEIASGFANNMTVLKEKMSEAITSKKYSIVNYALTTSEYKDFVKLEEKSITFTADNDESNIYTFEAKYNTDTPKQKFIQTAKVCGDTVYLLTVGLNLGTPSTTKYEDLIKTFTCNK